MNRPDNIVKYDEMDLKLGIKSSLPHAKSTLALAILLWEAAGKPFELVVSEEIDGKTVISDELKEKVLNYLAKLIESENIDSNQLIDIINENQLFKSQLEALIVAFELVWRIGKIEFTDSTKPASSERTGGLRFSKTMKYSANMDIIGSLVDSNNTEIIKVLLSWIGVDVASDKEYEKSVLSLLTVLSEGAVFKMSDNTTDIVFNQNCIYKKLLESKDDVDINGDKEAKGSLRILKSLLSDGMNPYLDYTGGNVSAVREDDERLIEYQNRVDTLLSLSGSYDYNLIKDEEEKSFNGDRLDVEWFNEKGKAYLYLDEEATKTRDDFLKKYNPEKLKELEGVALLRTIFLNDENKDNLCYQLEFDSKNRELFGSIKSGTAYKYGLHFSKKNGQWATGTGRNPQFLSIDEAIELGTQIRDYLVDGAEIIKAAGELDSLDEYRELYKKLNEATDGYINRVWFLKYYQMIAPEVFPPIYSKDAQTTLLKALGETPDNNAVVRMGQMQLFIEQCDLSPVVFSRTFWENYESADYDEEEEEMNTPIRFETGFDSKYARNRVVFGAPGTGKSFTLNQERKDLIGAENESDYERVTFHPDYSYANFVGTYKPVPCIDSEGRDSITYEYVPGPFMRVYVKALKNSRTDSIKPFLLLIEEINRANVAAVFGDIFQLLDRDDNGVSEYPIQATEDIKQYLAKELGGYPSDYEKIRIPDNLFIWASMNSADQGVFPMDTAFKRRWDFTYLGIDDSDELIRGKTVVLGTKVRQKVEWNKLRKAINKFLADKGINEDKQLGPYFIARKIVVPASGDEIDREKFINTFKNKVIMYLFEDAAKQKRPSLFEGCFEGNSRYSEICREFEEKGIGIFNHEIQLNAEPEDLTGPENSENE